MNPKTIYVLHLVVALGVANTRTAFAAVCGNSPTGAPIVCYETSSYPVVLITTFATAGTWEFLVANPQNLPGLTNTVDPMMWILDNNGGVIAIDNDSGVGLMPFISRTFSNTTPLLIMIAGASDNRQGAIDLTVRKSGTIGNTWSTLWFGGWRRTNLSVAVGDRMFVGFPNGGTNAGTPANTLMLLSGSASTCTTNCGQYSLAPWPVGTLSQLAVPFASTNSSVVIGSWYQPSIQGTRWFHSRTGTTWGSGTDFRDQDCDGLTREIEAMSSADANLDIRTCETPTDPPGSSCSYYSTRVVSGWSASDTDNDGLRDDWELFGVRKKCSQTPTAPFFNAGTCADDTFRYLRRDGVFCGDTSVPSAYTVSNAISTLQSRPRDYSVFIEAARPSGLPFSGPGLTLLNRIYETEGRECSESLSPACVNPDPDFVDLFYTDSIHPNEGRLAGQPSYWMASGNLNRHLSSVRKYTGVFYYANLVQNAVAGVGGNRAHIQNFGTSEYNGNVFAHELGHSLGMPTHRGSNAPTTDNVTNYPSIMNYWYGGNYAGKNPSNGTMFPADWFNLCSNPSHCPSSGQCVDGRCMRCGWQHSAFSRGENPPLLESAPGVDNYPQPLGWTTKFASEIGCNPRLRNGVADATDWVPLCLGPVCGIDWDQNGAYTETGFTSDFNFNGQPDVSADADDWQSIYNAGKIALGIQFLDRFRVFGSDFESTAPVDWSLGQSSLAPTAVSGVTSLSTQFGNALAFNGTTSQLVANANTSIRSVNVQVDPAVTPSGFRFDIYFKLDTFGTLGSQLVRSNLFGLMVSSTGTLFGELDWNGGGLANAIQLTSSVALGTWYWASLQWNRSSGRVRLALVRWTGSAWDWVGGTCARVTRIPAANVDPGNLVFGNDPTQSGFRLDGTLDQPSLWNSSNCVWGIDINNILSGCGSTAVPGCDP